LSTACGAPRESRCDFLGRTSRWPTSHGGSAATRIQTGRCGRRARACSPGLLSATEASGWFVPLRTPIRVRFRPRSDSRRKSIADSNQSLFEQRSPAAEQSERRGIACQRVDDQSLVRCHVVLNANQCSLDDTRLPRRKRGVLVLREGQGAFLQVCYAFGGLVNCGRCGCAMTAEIKKGL
jgi:hypothetical protein